MDSFIQDPTAVWFDKENNFNEGKSAPRGGKIEDHDDKDWNVLV